MTVKRTPVGQWWVVQGEVGAERSEWLAGHRARDLSRL